MAGCKIVNQGVLDAVSAIQGISGQYKEAGDSFITDLTNAISEMEGATKDAFQSFIEKDVKPFVTEQLPEAVEGMSNLLEVNRDNFEKVDAQIASSISS